MADWKRNLRPASFRGVPFACDQAQQTGGRRAVVHEFPFRDEPYSEDLGRKRRGFPIEAFVIGEDYFQARDALIEALETAGSGELIHPYRGSQNVQVLDYTLTETTQEGRIARFQIQFAEAGQPAFPFAATDSKNGALEAAQDLFEKAQKVFEDKFSVFRQAGFVVTAAQEKVQKVADVIAGSDKGLARANQDIAEFNFAARKLQTTIQSLVNAPNTLSSRIMQTLGLLQGASDAPGEIFNTMKKVFSFGKDDKIQTVVTPSRIRQNQNQAAVNSFTQQVYIGNAAQVAMDIEYQSTEQALEVRDTLTDALDEQIEAADDDDLYQSLYRLKTAVRKALPVEELDLARTVELNLRDSKPSLVVAYDFYESVDQEADLIARNNISNPGFLSPGKPLKVLSRG
jgi:prophage DNA circulation protein